MLRVLSHMRSNNKDSQKTIWKLMAMVMALVVSGIFIGVYLHNKLYTLNSFYMLIMLMLIVICFF